MPFIIAPNGQGTDVLSVPGGWAVLYDSGMGIVEAVPGESGPMATVKFKVYDANQRYNFANQLLGKWTGTPPGNLLYVGPYVYPPSPNLFCTSITSITSISKWLPMAGVGVPWLFGESAIVEAVFTRPPWQPATSGGYFTIDFAGNGETVTIPETSYFFTSTGAPTNTPVGVQIIGAEINVTRYRMPFLPDTYMIQLAGTINAGPFQIGNVVYAAGTLLFAPGNSQTQSDPLGNITYQATYKFLYKNPGWNYFLNPSTGVFDTIQDSNGLFPYTATNFNVLP